MEIDLTPLMDIVINILAAVLTAVGVWAVAKLGRKFGLEADDQVRVYLNDAIDRGIGYATEQARRKSADFDHVEVRSAAAAEAANYVIQRVPDAVKRFGLGPVDIRRMVEARLGGES